MTMAGTPRAFRSETEGRGASRWGCVRAFSLSVLLGLAACVADAPTSDKPASSPAFAGLASPTSAPSAPTAKPADRFHGMKRTDIARLLGRPDLLRRDGDAEIWQYRAGGCILDIFLYDEPGGMRVAHADLRGNAPGRSCAEAVAAGRTPAQTL
jgi:hypothetical protein